MLWTFQITTLWNVWSCSRALRTSSVWQRSTRVDAVHSVRWRHSRLVFLASQVLRRLSRSARCVPLRCYRQYQHFNLQWWTASDCFNCRSDPLYFMVGCHVNWAEHLTVPKCLPVEMYLPLDFISVFDIELFSFWSMFLFSLSYFLYVVFWL